MAKPRYSFIMLLTISLITGCGKAETSNTLPDAITPPIETAAPLTTQVSLSMEVHDYPRVNTAL